MSDPFKVIIIGAGTGGLCLAQGLKAAGIPVEVFERERTPTDRQGGYKLTIAPSGNRALKECLPEPVFQKLVQSSARASPGVSILDEHLKPLLLESRAAYEREMIEYGFRAVRASLANVRLVHSEGIGRELTKLGFRLMNLFPHLKGKFTNR